MMKRPTGMTILLVLSFINACLQIFINLTMYIGTPMMNEMISSGQMEEIMAPFLSGMDESMVDAVMAQMTFRASISPVFYLWTFLLYIGSLVGVLQMFKLQRVGFHIYSISQLLILIVGVVYVYTKQKPNPLLSEFLTTLMFILIYHLYFKRIEYQNPPENPYEPQDTPTNRE